MSTAMSSSPPITNMLRNLAPQTTSSRVYHELVAALVYDAKHEGAPAAVRRDESPIAEEDLRRRTGKACEDDAGHDREAEQADQRLDGDQDVRRHVDRRDVPVADGGQGMHA